MKNRLQFKIPHINLNLFKTRLTPARLRDSIIGEWFLPGDEMSSNRMTLLIFSINANIIANLVGGNYFTGLLLLMNADDSFIGLVGMIPFAASIVQLFAPLVIERFKKRKQFLTWFRFGAIFINAAFVSIIPFMPIARQAQLTLVALALIIVNCTHAMLNPGFTIWHMQSLPNRMRAAYFSTQSVVINILVVLATMLASALVDVFKGYGQEIVGIMIIRGIATVLVFLDAYLLMRLKEYPYEESSEKLKILDVFTKPLRSGLYMRSVWAGVLWSFAANMPSSFYTVYMLKNIGVSYSYITVMSMINIPCMIIFMPMWRRVVGKTGKWMRTVAIAMSGYLTYLVVLAFVTKANYMYLYPLALIIAYPLGAGITLGFGNVPYLNMPKENQTMYFAFYSTACNVAAFFAVLLSRTIMATTDGFTLNFFGFPMVNKQFYLLLVAFLMGVAAFAIYRMQSTLNKRGADS